MDTSPFTKSQIFCLIWMAIIVAYLFGGPRNYGPVPVELSFLLVGATIFSLVVLGRRFPMFGYCTIVIFVGLLSALTGSRGRR
jgi:MFS superfamily sulfate permease-like transporter